MLVTGAVLASPITSQINSILSMQLNLIKKPIYTGIHATFSKGDFHSIEGVPYSEIKNAWKLGQPMNVNNDEQCSVLLEDGSLKPVKCSETYPYVCYKEKTEDLLVNQCGTVDNDYKYNKETRHCYKIHREPRTFQKAFMACSSEGGYLAVINSIDEANSLKSLFSQNPESSMAVPSKVDAAFVGITREADSEEWRTIHGQSLIEAGFGEFPTRDFNAEGCGAVDHNGRYIDLPCDAVAPFVCERNTSYCPENFISKFKYDLKIYKSKNK
ncbi:unnamed protein product [Chilo suppressalis]|uniref:C-type lectin domain-containing protein n=1 Tax=Chilo suppressalis TaxID=168631 RepID=A0ABN8L7K9_CHISP|nr:unnamed protein product [Chilo suppressalis]